MTVQPTRLRAELEEAKRQLEDSIHVRKQTTTFQPEAPPAVGDERPALSKLNRLMGKTSVPKRGLSLFQQVGVPQRPTYDMIADRILGPDVEAPDSFLDQHSGYANHVAERLVQLRQRLDAAQTAPPSEGSDLYVGVGDDGTPVWSQVLNEQRGEARSALEDTLASPAPDDVHHATRVLDINADWPKRLAWSSSLTFKHWFAAQENLDATHACEQVIDPAGTSTRSWWSQPLRLDVHTFCTLPVRPCFVVKKDTCCPSRQQTHPSTVLRRSGRMHCPALQHWSLMIFTNSHTMKHGRTNLACWLTTPSILASSRRWRTSCRRNDAGFSFERGFPVVF